MIYFAVGVFCTLFFYQMTNRLHFIEPKLLPFGYVDSAAPFWPWSVWVYFLEYLMFWIAYFGLQDWENVTKYFLSYMAILAISTVVFVVFPVTFPRETFGVEAYPESVSKTAILFLRNYMDTPANCLPSLHVSSCYISAFCFWKESRWKFVFLNVISTMVAISTLTTKQHYFIDVWTAILLTMLCYWIFFHKISYSKKA